MVGRALEPADAGIADLQALVDDGHLIANHTEHHYSLTQHEPAVLTEAQVIAELAGVDLCLMLRFETDDTAVLLAATGLADDLAPLTRRLALGETGVSGTKLWRRCVAWRRSRRWVGIARLAAIA